MRGRGSVGSQHRARAVLYIGSGDARECDVVEDDRARKAGGLSARQLFKVVRSEYERNAGLTAAYPDSDARVRDLGVDEEDAASALEVINEGVRSCHLR